MKLYDQCQALQDALVQYQDKHEDNEEKMSCFLYNRISKLITVLKDTMTELREIDRTQTQKYIDRLNEALKQGKES